LGVLIFAVTHCGSKRDLNSRPHFIKYPAECAVFFAQFRRILATRDARSQDVAKELLALGGARVILATAPDGFVSTSLGSQVADGLAGRNVDLFRGHAQVRGGHGVQPMIETFPLERVADAHERMISGKVRLQVGFEDLMPAKVPWVRTNCRRLPRRIQGESSQGFRPAVVRLCRMSSATVLYTRERNCQRGFAAQVV
jgi:hypothetical protein